ncbi:MAG: NAD(P)-dependent oxidoreductase [Euryarchaeota archaeon TMED85]|nr:MAG: NAD(P)-dependent oxidoreductase [Euryarchaeota archaeon TMED85]|tara:strand:+ start:10771 stop:11628 length:858 start_codon:yes stop_codon:yes gene_type:complete
MNQIILTGANGFIGKNLLQELVKEDVEVIAVVRDKKNIKNIANKIKIVEMDISQPSKEFFEKINSSASLVHLAWNGLTDYKSMAHIETELPIHFNFVKSLILHGVKNITITGTCFEYGLQQGMLSENLQTKPITSYGYSKDALRKHLEFFQNEIDFNLTWLRLFYVYGEDQPDNTLFSQLRKAVEKGESFFNMSGGKQLRDYLHIKDLVKKINILALKQKNFGIINVCSGFPIAVKRLVEDWKKEKGWNIKLNTGYYDYPSHEPMAFWGDISKLQKILDEKNEQG